MPYLCLGLMVSPALVVSCAGAEVAPAGDVDVVEVPKEVAVVIVLKAPWPLEVLEPVDTTAAPLEVKVLPVAEVSSKRPPDKVLDGEMLEVEPAEVAAEVLLDGLEPLEPLSELAPQVPLDLML